MELSSLIIVERNTIGKIHTTTIQRQVIVNLERRLNVKRAPRAHRLFVWFRFFQTSEETWSKSMTALLCNSHFESLHSLDTVMLRDYALFHRMQRSFCFVA